MLSLTVVCCPICYQPHQFTNIPSPAGDLELRCPTFGNSFPVQITAIAQPLPIRGFGTARQGMLLPTMLPIEA